MLCILFARVSGLTFTPQFDLPNIVIDGVSNLAMSRGSHASNLLDAVLYVWKTRGSISLGLCIIS